MDLQRILWAIATAPSAALPPDPEACKECAHHPSRLKFSGDNEQHCYLFKTLPDTLCMQFKRGWNAQSQS